MNVTFTEVEKIFKTLPLSYYCKRKVKATLTEDTKSYYDPMKDEIFVSFPMIQSVANKIESANVEQMIRNLLYHEVSHAFITPTNLTVSRIINIFEDERIESVLRKYYMNVNFREFVKQVADYHGEKPKNVDEAFYQLVRFRVCDNKDFLKRVHELIMKHRGLNRCSPYWPCETYKKDVNDLYGDFKRWYEDEIEDADESEKSEESSMNGDKAESSFDKSDEPNEPIKADCDELEENDNEESDVGFAGNVIADGINQFADEKMQEQINLILQNISKSSHRNGSAINSYSGIFDPRSAGQDDCKFFTQKNRLGHIKAYSKIHLNLFIDRSGSFCESEELVNKLLFALAKFESVNENFTFDLVTCACGERLEPKDKRVLKTGGGNDLDKEIFELYRRLQLSGQMNYNIVLFDGDAFTDTSWGIEEEAHKNFGAFNHSNVVIISDDDNEDYITEFAPSAKHIFTTRYAEELINNVMTALQTLTR